MPFILKIPPFQNLVDPIVRLDLISGYEIRRVLIPAVYKEFIYNLSNWQSTGPIGSIYVHTWQEIHTLYALVASVIATILAAVTALIWIMGPGL